METALEEVQTCPAFQSVWDSWLERGDGEVGTVWDEGWVGRGKGRLKGPVGEDVEADIT